MKKVVLICMMLAIAIAEINAQRTVSGTVLLDGEGEAIGANVVVDGDEGVGTVTEFDGTFSLTVPTSAKALKISYTGFTTQIVSIEGVNRVNVILLQGAVLEECVVVGYGSRQKSALKGSAATIRIRGTSSIKSKRQNNTFHDPETNEQYGKTKRNKFINSSKEKFSTFSIDVDHASYSNVRRFINNEGRLPPQDAVRIEEMINYFNYDYPIPVETAPFSVTTDLADCPWNKSNQLLRVGLQGYKMELIQAPVNNLVFLIDVSGSMSDDLALIKESLSMLVSGMRDEDRIAIVVYAGNSGLVLPSTTGKNKQKIMEALNRLQSGGSTAGGAGIRLAYKTAKSEFIENGNNRIILCTDGDFNVGISNVSDLEKLIVEKRNDDIFLTVLGFGMGNYKDEQLETLANKGNGNYGYIDNLKEAKKMLVDEVASTMFTIAKDVKIQIEFDPNSVKSYRLIGYENRLLDKKDFSNDKKDAGELGAGHTVTALYEIVPKRKMENQENLATIRLRYKAPKGKKSQLIETIIANQSKSMEEAGADFNFAAAVAAWGMLLKDSPHKGDTDIKIISELIEAGMGEDENGYRQEFKELVEKSAQWGEGWAVEE